MIYTMKACGYIPYWVVICVVPLLVASFGGFIENVQLRYGTYFYVHRMVQYDLQQVLQPHVPENKTSMVNIKLTNGKTPEDVSFGSLQDTGIAFLPDYKKAGISVLDTVAMIFPYGFLLMAVAVDNPFVWTRIFVSFCALAIGKGFFAWITVIPDSGGWARCKKRLSTYFGMPVDLVDWYAQERGFWEIATMTDPRNCADMMWSGHTHFVVIFAFGLHECVRLAMLTYPKTHRVFAESIVGIVAVLQQGIEIYFVLQDRYHYTADVVMAVLLAYLLFTSHFVSEVSYRWCWHPLTKKVMKEFFSNVQNEMKKSGVKYSVNLESKWWRHGLNRGVVLTPACCCLCPGTQHFMYNRRHVINIFDSIQTLTKDLEKDQKLDRTSKLFMLTEMQILHERSVHCSHDSEDETESESSEDEGVCPRRLCE